MSGLLPSLAGFLVAIVVLVAVHEAGHFLAARRLGIGVLRFAIGFGKPLWSRRGRDGVEYVIGMIPLGGYVKMLDEREGPIEPARAASAFNRQPVPRRIAVLLAGPAANLLFAVLIYWVVLVMGIPGLRPLVAAPEAGSPAARIGLTAEDEVVAVAGRETSTWEGVSLGLLDAVLDGAPTVALRVASPAGGVRELDLPLAEHRSLTEPGALLAKLGLAPWRPRYRPEVGAVVEGGPGARADLRAGDRVLALDGQEVWDLPTLIQLIRARPGARSELTVDRGGRTVALTVELDRVEDQGEVRGQVGATFGAPAAVIERLRATQRYSPLAAVPEAFRRTVELSALTLKVLARMLTGDASLSNISGPINIAQYAGVTASIGPVAFLGFLAVVSVSLGMLNLLPVPILDGGQVVFLAVEALRGSPIPERIELIGQQLGVALLIGLMGLAFYNDLARLFG
jgi:regulator of sigma E protease